MGEPSEILEHIVAELAAIQDVNPFELMEKDEFRLPRLIPAPDGRTIQITKSIDDKITALALLLKDQQHHATLTIRDREYIRFVRSIIGISIIENHESPNISDVVIDDIKIKLNKFISAIRPCEYAFGLTLFDSEDMRAFKIGPATIELRQDWLIRKRNDGTITNVIHRRILRAWSGKKLHRRARNIDEIRERDILQVIGSCKFVCTIHDSGRSEDAGRDLSIMASRIAITCISLLWEHPSTALDGFRLNIDGGVRREKFLKFIPGTITLQGSRLRRLPVGPRMSNENWIEILHNHKPYFDICGDIISFVLSKNRSSGRYRVYNALLNALIWFYEGCKEESDLLSIIYFAASLDALGGGRKTKGILQVLNARLGIADTDRIHDGGPTFKSIVEKIYSDGRSRAIHGTSDRIGHDWLGTRGIAETLARHALYTSLNWAGANAAIDDPERLKVP